VSNIEVTSTKLPAFSDITSLQQIHACCWSELDRGVTDREFGWRRPVLGTSEPGGCRQRVVVLRSVDAKHRTLFIHTDIRSAKVASIQRQPSVSWLFYDAAAMVQLQLNGTATLHTADATADRFWNSEPESSLRGYLAPYSPGTACQQPEPNLPEFVINRIPSRDELIAGRDNFAVISCVVETMEWLLLRRQGNLRARFCYQPTGTMTSEWLAP